MVQRSSEKYRGQRSKEKRELFAPFRFRVVEELYKRRFFEIFGNRCFKCGSPEKLKQEIGAPPILCIDHHIPMALGGHLVPGNLVALCRGCNGIKLDRDPAEFYTTEELQRLESLFEAQSELFGFNFDWNKWSESREKYLLELGVAPELVDKALHDEWYEGYVGTGP